MASVRIVLIESCLTLASVMRLTICAERRAGPDQVLQPLVGVVLLAHRQRRDDRPPGEVDEHCLALVEGTVQLLSVVPGRIAEETHGDAMELGEEAGDDVVSALTGGEQLPELGALVVRVRPVLDAAATAEHGVIEAGDVADRVDALDGRLEALVDDDAVIHLDSRALEPADRRRNADADDGEVGFELEPL